MLTNPRKAVPGLTPAEKNAIIRPLSRRQKERLLRRHMDLLTNAEAEELARTIRKRTAKDQ